MNLSCNSSRHCCWVATLFTPSKVSTPTVGVQWGKKKHAPPPRKGLLIFSHPALYVTFAGWAAQASWWWLWGTHSCAVVGLQGTCSETGIRLVHHLLLAASRLQRRVTEMGCQGHRASCQGSCCGSSTRPCREILRRLCSFETRRPSHSITSLPYPQPITLHVWGEWGKCFTGVFNVLQSHLAKIIWFSTHWFYQSHSPRVW